MEIRSYRDLDVWKKAMDLVEACYRATTDFPPYERYGLSSQIQRSAISVPSNIAEGRGRQHTAEFIHFVSIASGSLAELETQIEIARRLGYVTEDSFYSLHEQCSAIGRMLNGLLYSLRQKTTRS